MAARWLRGDLPRKRLILLSQIRHEIRRIRHEIRHEICRDIRRIRLEIRRIRCEIRLIRREIRHAKSPFNGAWPHAPGHALDELVTRPCSVLVMN